MMKGRTKRFNVPVNATKLMAVINHLMGLRPFDDSTGQPRILLSLPYLVVLLSVMCSAITFMDIFPNTQRTVGKYITVLYSIPNFTKALCLTFLGYYHSKTFHVYKRRMLNVDESLYKLGVPPKYRGSFFSSMIIIIACFSYIAFTFHINISWFIVEMGVPIGLYVACCYLYATTLEDVMLLDFVIFVRSAKARYKMVNDLLQVFATNDFHVQEKNNSLNALLPVIPLRSNNWMRSRTNFANLEPLSRTEEQWEYVEKRNWRLQMIKRVHLELCQASNLLLKMFEVQVVLQIGLSVMRITATLYAIYANISESSFESQTTMEKICPTVYCILEFGKLFLLSRTCEHACREEEKGLSIVHACYSSVIDTEMKDEIRQFALQMSHCQKGCTKRYLSRLNYSLLSKCVGIIAMYLVILVQMDQSLEAKNSPVMVNTSIIDSHHDP